MLEKKSIPFILKGKRWNWIHIFMFSMFVNGYCITQRAIIDMSPGEGRVLLKW